MRAIAFLCLASLTFAAENPAAHVRNFGEVNEHLFRGAEPSLAGLQELAGMGVKMVIDLREPGGGTEFERQQVEKLGMKYVNVPFRPFSAPSQAQMQHVLTLIDDDSQHIFVHCRRGKDRTGTVIACYRIQHDHWQNRQALEEAKKYGISIEERGMRSYILHFSPRTQAASQQAAK
jgi:protein tyrosine/serine phosphatase